MSNATTRGEFARLALADGTVFEGRAFGAVGRGLASVAEVVFNTAMTGYQESLTDPSYTGQILVQTFPLIGNTGTNGEDVESSRIQVSGLVVRELANRHSNFRATATLEGELARAGVLGIEGVDTRALTKILRTGGSTQGALTDRPRSNAGAISDGDLAALARKAPTMAGQNLIPRVGCNSGSRWSETLGEWSGGGGVAPGAKPLRVLALDCGAKRNILRNLVQRGCEVEVVPHDTPAGEIRRRYEAGEIDGLFISNGPGDPSAVETTISNLRDLLGGGPENTIPTFGICLGHQLLALAVGAKTYKLKFGHRGINQPVLGTERGRVEITSQNHGFAVDPATLPPTLRPTHVSLFDGSLQGLARTDRPAFCFQGHPEASPGQHDVGYLFDRFVKLMDERRA